MDESYFDPYKVPDAFIQRGREKMKEKFLVIRRDGSIPEWPWFVLDGRSPWSVDAAKAYLKAAEVGGADDAYVEAIREKVAALEAYPKGGNHEDGPDDSSIVGLMRDNRGGKLFVVGAWSAEQVKRKAEADKENGCGS